MTSGHRTPRHNLLVTITFDQLDVFRTVVRAGSFRRAAAHLNLSQPAVSQRIRHLEDVLGAALFDRFAGSRIRVTEAGERLLAFADAALLLMDQFHADLEAHKRPDQPAQVAVAAGPSFTKYRLLPLLPVFHRVRPDVRLTLRAGANPEEVPEIVRRGDAELGFVVGPVPTDLACFFTGSDDFVLVAPPADPVLKVPREERLSYLAGIDFAISPFSANSRQLIQKWTQRLGVELRITIETANLDTLKEAVLQGVALAILPDFAVEDDARAGRVVVVDTAGLPIRREMNLVGRTDRPLSFGAQAFLEVFARHPRPQLPSPE